VSLFELDIDVADARPGFGLEPPEAVSTSLSPGQGQRPVWSAGQLNRQWSSRVRRYAVGPAGRGLFLPGTASLDIRPRRPGRGRPASVDPARTSAVPLVAQVAVRYPLVDRAVVPPSIEEVIVAVRARRTADPATACSGGSACSDLATWRGVAAARGRPAYRLTAAGRRRSGARGCDPTNAAREPHEPGFPVGCA
jgi:hypothetical protein